MEKTTLHDVMDEDGFKRKLQCLLSSLVGTLIEEHGGENLVDRRIHSGFHHSEIRVLDATDDKLALLFKVRTR